MSPSPVERMPPGRLYFIELECAATGERRFVDYEFPGADYMFVDGNYSCDCNRSAIFGHEHVEDNCSDGRFILIRIWEDDIPAVRSELCDDIKWGGWVVRKAWP